jgi:hypothetical protein
MTFLRSARRMGLALVAAAAVDLPVGAAELSDIRLQHASTMCSRA